MNKALILCAVASAVLLSSCARAVVLDPAAIDQKNSKDWTIKSEPQKQKK